MLRGLRAVAQTAHRFPPAIKSAALHTSSILHAALPRRCFRGRGSGAPGSSGGAAAAAGFGVAAGLAIGAAASVATGDPFESMLAREAAFSSIVARAEGAGASAHGPMLEVGGQADHLFTADEVTRHASANDGIWVTLGPSVYDITEFVASHPGGKDKIMQAAGGALEPFWELYTVHTTTAWESISALLETYRIGSLADYDPVAAADKTRRGQREKRRPGLWDGEPARHPGLIVRGERPFNAEVPLQALGDAEVTPKGLHYVRNHHPVPVVAEGTHMIQVEVPRGDGTAATLSFTADELRARFPKHVVRATIQCGGNRRGQLGTAGKTMGLQWSAGAISTADWGGARLKDVLGAAGLTEDEAERCGVQHVQFVPIDAPFDASIPIAKALSSSGDVILAYEMNGEVLPREHGYPVRVVVPGHIGARSVKWLSKIVARPDEADSSWQRGVAYKAFSPNVKSFAGLDHEAIGFAVQELPVQSAITQPAAEAALVPGTGGRITVKGYAWSGGGRAIARVDVSPDGGRSWQTAELGPGNTQKHGRAWAWTLWSVDLELPAEVVAGGQAQLVCKAVDSACNQQPSDVGHVWNLRGVLNNAWHRVGIELASEHCPSSHESG